MVQSVPCEQPMHARLILDSKIFLLMFCDGSRGQLRVQPDQSARTKVRAALLFLRTHAERGRVLLVQHKLGPGRACLRDSGRRGGSRTRQRSLNGGWSSKLPCCRHELKTSQTDSIIGSTSREQGLIAQWVFVHSGQAHWSRKHSQNWRKVTTHGKDTRTYCRLRLAEVRFKSSGKGNGKRRELERKSLSLSLG